MEIKLRNTRRLKRKKRVRGKISGTKLRPRMSVYRSNKNIFVQLIDDTTGKTLIGISNKNITSNDNLNKSDIAGKLGEELAKSAKKLQIKRVVFDRSAYRFHGRIKALVESARKGGLEF